MTPGQELMLYRMAYGEKTPRELEFSGTRTARDGTEIECCPVCNGIEYETPSIPDERAGHRPGCRMAAFVEIIEA